MSGEPTILIGYSMGGLIARTLVERLEIRAQAVVLVGTPNKGIKLSWWEKLLLRIFKKPCVRGMLPESPGLQHLNKEYIEEYKEKKLVTRYYLIAGKEDKKVPLNSAMGIIDAQGSIILSTDHSGLIPRKPTSKPNAIGEIIKILKKEINLSTPSFFIFVRQSFNFLVKII